MVDGAVVSRNHVRSDAGGEVGILSQSLRGVVHSACDYVVDLV